MGREHEVNDDYDLYHFEYYDDDGIIHEGEDNDIFIESDDDDQTTQFSVSADGKTVNIGEYQINNDLTARCVGYDDISVTISTEYERLLAKDYDTDHGTQSFGKATICYSFPVCQSGKILYDPFVYYEGEDEGAQQDTACLPISI